MKTTIRSPHCDFIYSLVFEMEHQRHFIEHQLNLIEMSEKYLPNQERIVKVANRRVKQMERLLELYPDDLYVDLQEGCKNYFNK